MRVSDLITLAFNLSSIAQRELHIAWIAHSLELSKVAGDAHVVNAQRNGDLDLLLRRLDEEADKKGSGSIDFCLSIRSSFSNTWVLSAYEMVRAASEQMKLKKQEDKKLEALKYRLGLVRMPTAKGQIQGKERDTRRMVLAHADGSDRKNYANDGSYMTPIGICPETGSAVWCPVDAKKGQSVPIRRIDLSNELLALFA